jgi:hypothetical protein
MKTFEEQKRLTELKYLRTGDKIHIKSRDGLYTFLKKDFRTGEIHITCKRWQYEENPIRVTSFDDFKCLAGGIWRIINN